jgi:hypothetical protein
MYTNLRKESKMTIQITHTTHKYNNTSYTGGIHKKDKDLVLDTLSNGLFDVLQRSNYDQNIKEFIHTSDDVFRKQTAVSNKQNNSLASFVAGVLEQFKQNPSKDFSVKQLEGITAATRYFNIIDSNKHEDIEFEDTKNITPLPGNLNHSFFERKDQ